MKIRGLTPSPLDMYTPSLLCYPEQVGQEVGADKNLDAADTESLSLP